MDLELFYNLLILGVCSICISYLIRSKDGAVYFLVTVLTIVPLTFLAVRNIELAVVMLTMVIVWEIRSLRKDSE